MKTLIGLSFLMLITSAHAGFKGQIDFSDEEKSTHTKNIKLITETAANCLKDTWNDHTTFFKKYGVSKYYGDRNPALDTPAERLQKLIEYKVNPSFHKEILSQMKGMSCIGLARLCLEKGFSAAGPISVASWKKIDAYGKLNGLDGSSVMNALQKLGWKILFWNPDPTQNADWDADDLKINPENKSKYWGYHSYRYKSVMNKGNYYFNKVDDTHSLVGFGNEAPEVLKTVPFFMGVAHTGYHVFPGFYGQVIEAHSMRALNSVSNLENSPFNPLGPGGAPRWTKSEKYRSGIIAIPPRD